MPAAPPPTLPPLVPWIARKFDDWRISAIVSRWSRLPADGHTTVVPLNELRAAQARIRELELVLGSQRLENEILRAALDEAANR